MSQAHTNVAKAKSPGATLTSNDIMEELSYAYLHAVAAQCGFSAQKRDKDRDSVDATIHARGRLCSRSTYSSPSIDVQLKATYTVAASGTAFSFDVPIKNYDDLRVEDRLAPCILVILLMPKSRDKWLTHDPSGLI